MSTPIDITCLYSVYIILNHDFTWFFIIFGSLNLCSFSTQHSRKLNIVSFSKILESTSFPRWQNEFEDKPKSWCILKSPSLILRSAVHRLPAKLTNLYDFKMTHQRLPKTIVLLNLLFIFINSTATWVILLHFRFLLSFSNSAHSLLHYYTLHFCNSAHYGEVFFFEIPKIRHILSHL